LIQRHLAGDTRTGAGAAVLTPNDLSDILARDL
jgi:hypothetical protein